MNTGQHLYNQAKKIIPGGTMLLSKRPEMFLPDLWPSYFSKAKGCQIWDLDGNRYHDLSIMGIGTNILGYGHDEVDSTVHEVIQKGNVSTFNCPEEVFLAEQLIDMHPWSDMARFCRTGGEACAIGIRIARAASGRDKVAFCGYHGWHDWYLATNLRDDQDLSGHLLSGLEPNGVPKQLKDSIFPFTYNRVDELKNIVDEHNPGVIIMEVSRNVPPNPGFLESVRDIASKNNIVLIFDEISAGFRKTFGGLHKEYNVNPDMAIFGKALGNGYAINAIIGEKEVMEAAQTSFISSTFWTERIGPAAALKTLEVMQKEKSWQVIDQRGAEIKKKWKSLGDQYQLTVSVSGLNALASFRIESEHFQTYKTYITQSMLERGYLASNTIYVSTAHSEPILDEYFEILDEIFSTIQKCESGDKDIKSLLKGPVSHSGFKRLN